MNFKQHFFKKIVPVYFMVVTFLNIGMMIVGKIFFEEIQFGYEVFASPLFFGLIGCVPPLLEYLCPEKSANKAVILAQTVFKLVAVEVCMLCSAMMLGLDSWLMMVIIACMVMVIYVIVCVMQYFQDRVLCVEMNNALSDYKKIQSDK